MNQPLIAPTSEDDIFARAQQTLRIHEQAEGDERYSAEELNAEREALKRLMSLQDYMCGRGK